MNPETQAKLVAILVKLFPGKFVSINIDCSKHKPLFKATQIEFEFTVYVEDRIYEEFDNALDVIAYIKSLSERSELNLSPETLKFSDFERGINEKSL